MVKTLPCNTGSSGLFSDWGAKILRSHMLMAKKLEHKQEKLYSNKFNKDFKKKWVAELQSLLPTTDIPLPTTYYQRNNFKEKC